MNWLDIVIVIAVIISTLSGLKAGLIKMALSFAGLIIGVMLAGRYHAALAEKLTFIPQENIAGIVAFALIMIAVMIAASIAAAALRTIIKAIMLGFLDHLAGGAIGFLMGGVFCAALLAVWAKFFGTEGILGGSVLAPILLDRLPLILAFLPKEFDQIRSFFK